VVVALTARRSPSPRRLRRLGGLKLPVPIPHTRRLDDLTWPASPSADLRADRTATLVPPLAFTLSAGLVLVVAAQVGDVAYWPPEVFTGFALAAGTALNIALCASAWFRFAVVRFLLAARGRLPWRLVPFLDDARGRGVLRQIGPVYEFRHAMLGDVLREEYRALTGRKVGTGSAGRA
jgi:hypothetical protein